MIECGDEIYSQAELCELFNGKYPEQILDPSTVNSIARTFEKMDIRDGEQKCS